MRVLLVHNRYQIAGGEDAVVAQESAILSQGGVEVESFLADNDAICGVGAKLRTAAEVAYSWSMRKRLEAQAERFRPDVVHVHNFFPRITPSAYDAAGSSGAAVVQTLHNYRLLCPSATLFRDNHVCEDCVGRAVPWPAVQHGCYRGSRAGSAAVAVMLGVNRIRGAWRHRVHRYIALTEFSRELFASSGALPPERISVKPNATADPVLPDIGLSRTKQDRGFALYAGRLSPEKGIGVLLEAARAGLALPLVVAGTGPLSAEVEEAQDRGLLTYVGGLSAADLQRKMRQASVLLLPSLWYEGLPMVVAEAYAASLPIVASNIGSLASLVVDGATGLHAITGSADSLREAVARLARDKALAERLSHGARCEYEARYRPEANFAQLIEIYGKAIETAHQRVP